MKKKLFLFLIIIIAIGTFYKLGRPIWKPYYQKIMGKETLESIEDKYRSTVLERISNNLSIAGFSNFPDEILLIGYKSERELHLYGRINSKWKLIKAYPFTNFSGQIGPKLKEGDKQIPEGIYNIEYLNPNSAYHLSLKVSYPNDYDKQKAKLENRTLLGGDIFIHGDNVTVGCIPIGDEAVEEVFTIANNSITNGIKVIIAPYKFGSVAPPLTENNVSWAEELYSNIKTEIEKEGILTN